VIVRAELIKPFVAPEWRIERVGKECDEGDLELLNAGLRSGRAEIVASDLTGWAPYTHVLRYHYQDAVTDFLAQIDTEEYLVRLP
jgi:hypothetical protein